MSEEAVNSGQQLAPFSKENDERSLRSKRRLLGAIALAVALEVLVAVGVGGYLLGHSGSGTDSRITVTGSGTVRGVPDTVQFQIGFHSVSANLSSAMATTSYKIQQKEAVHERQGVLKSGLQTSGIAIYQNYNNRGVVNGMAFDETLDVTIHSVAKSGAAISAAVRVAGNSVQFNGITLSISNKKSIFAEARARAMQDAFTKASQLAQSGHTTVGTIVRIRDQENQYTPTYYANQFADSASAYKSAVTIQPGVQSVTVHVDVIYSLHG